MKKQYIKGMLVGLVLGSIFFSSISIYADDFLSDIKVYFDFVKIKVNDVPVETETILYEGTTYAPIRDVAEMLNKNILWDPKTGTAHINDKKETEVDILNPTAIPSPTPIIENVLPTPMAKTDETVLQIHHSYSIINANSVGNEWSSWVEIDGKSYYDQQLDLNVTDAKIEAVAVICESDDGKSDFGYKKFTIYIEDLDEGANKFEYDINVTENGGRYTGNTAICKFYLTITKG